MVWENWTDPYASLIKYTKSIVITALKWILFWLARVIFLTGVRSAAVAYGITVKSRQVKVRLPLNLKNMRRVRGVSTCVVPVYAACQASVCVRMRSLGACARVHNVYSCGWRITMTWFIDEGYARWVTGGGGRMCPRMRTSVIKYASQQKTSAHTCPNTFLN